MSDAIPVPRHRRDLTPAHVGLVAWFSARFAMRTGGGLVYLLAAMLTGLLIASAFISPIENVMKRSEVREAGYGKDRMGEVAQQIVESPQITGAVKNLTGADDAQTDYLLRSKPALVSAIAIVLLIAFPFLTCFGAFNQTSGDIGSKGLRYLLLRTERVNVFLGRFVGTYLFIVLNTIVVVAIVLVYVGVKLKAYEAGSLIGWGLQVIAALALVSLAYASICAWFSAMIDSPAGALVVCLLVTGFPILFLSILAHAIEPEGIPWIQRLHPWGWKHELLAQDVGTRLLACGVMVGFSAVFLALGLRTFSKRDL